MKIEEITLESLGEALRILRRQAGLTQAEVSRRTEEFQPPLKRITSNRLCAFERGGAIPSIMSLFSILVACNADLSRFQDALTGEPIASFEQLESLDP